MLDPEPVEVESLSPCWLKCGDKTALGLQHASVCEARGARQQGVLITDSTGGVSPSAWPQSLGRWEDSLPWRPQPQKPVGSSGTFPDMLPRPGSLHF